MSTTASLLRTPFHDFHVSNGGKMVDFAGWEMPLHYGSIIDEHKQVRTSGGLFDVSHMGRVRFTGKDARAFLDHICTRQIIDMTPGAVRYSLVCNPSGGCRDDVLVYRIDESEFLMVVNASNRLKLLEHFAAVKAERGFVFKMNDETESTAMIAIQGPAVMPLIANFSSEVPALKRYRFAVKNVLFQTILISRTGYTGEDGVEVIFPARLAGQILKLMFAQGGDMMNAVKPAGLGARDSLRLEAGMPLYGHEITEDQNPLAAGLTFAVKLDKGAAASGGATGFRPAPSGGGATSAESQPASNTESFIGQRALQQIAQDQSRPKLVGLTLDGRRSPRQGMKVLATDSQTEVGVVTSGCLSPTLDKPIAMAYVPPALATPGTRVRIDLGKATADAEVAKLPFYSKTH